MKEIPRWLPRLRLVSNDVANAKMVFGGGRSTPEFTYLGAPLHVDFELTYENLAPFVTEVLDQAALTEAAGLRVMLVEIRKGQVTVW